MHRHFCVAQHMKPLQVMILRHNRQVQLDRLQKRCDRWAFTAYGTGTLLALATSDFHLMSLSASFGLGIIGTSMAFSRRTPLDPDLARWRERHGVDADSILPDVMDPAQPLYRALLEEE